MKLTQVQTCNGDTEISLTWSKKVSQEFCQSHSIMYASTGEPGPVFKRFILVLTCTAYTPRLLSHYSRRVKCNKPYLVKPQNQYEQNKHGILYYVSLSSTAAIYKQEGPMSSADRCIRPHVQR